MIPLYIAANPSSLVIFENLLLPTACVIGDDFLIFFPFRSAGHSSRSTRLPEISLSIISISFLSQCGGRMSEVHSLTGWYSTNSHIPAFVTVRTNTSSFSFSALQCDIVNNGDDGQVDS